MSLFRQTSNQKRRKDSIIVTFIVGVCVRERQRAYEKAKYEPVFVHMYV